MAARSFLINNTFSTLSKLLSSNTYCWSSDTFATTCWTHFWVNGIGAKSFRAEKTNAQRRSNAQRERCSLRDAFNGNVEFWKSASIWRRYVQTTVAYFLVLPSGIRDSSSTHSFRRLLKTHCFQQAFGSPLAAHASASDSASGWHCAL